MWHDTRQQEISYVFSENRHSLLSTNIYNLVDHEPCAASTRQDFNFTLSPDKSVRTT